MALHTLVYKSPEDLDFIKDQFNQLQLNPNFKPGDSFQLIKDDTLTSSYTVTSKETISKEELVSDINDIIENVITEKNGLHLKNSHITAPHNVSIKDARFRHSTIELADNAIVEGATLTNITSNPLSIKKLQRIQKVLMANANLTDVSEIIDTAIININNMDINNSTLRDIDIVRTPEQLSKSKSTLYIYDTPFSGFEHDMFDEDKHVLGDLVVSSSNVRQFADHIAKDKALEKHKSLKKEQRLKEYSDVESVHTLLNEDKVGRIIAFTPETIGYFDDVSTHENDIFTIGDKHLASGNSIVFSNPTTGSQMYLMLDKNSLADPNLKPSILQKATDFYNLNHISPKDHTVRIQNSYLSIPANASLKDLDMEYSTLVLSNLEDSKVPAFVHNSTLTGVKMNSMSENKTYSISDSYLTDVTISDITYIDNVYVNEDEHERMPYSTRLENAVVAKDIIISPELTQLSNTNIENLTKLDLTLSGGNISDTTIDKYIIKALADNATSHAVVIGNPYGDHNTIRTFDSNSEKESYTQALPNTHFSLDAHDSIMESPNVESYSPEQIKFALVENSMHDTQQLLSQKSNPDLNIDRSTMSFSSIMPTNNDSMRFSEERDNFLRTATESEKQQTQQLLSKKSDPLLDDNQQVDMDLNRSQDNSKPSKNFEPSLEM